MVPYHFCSPVLFSPNKVGAVGCQRSWKPYPGSNLGYEKPASFTMEEAKLIAVIAEVRSLGISHADL